MTGGLSTGRLARLKPVLERHVAGGHAPGLVALVSRGGETEVVVVGDAAVGGGPMRRDTIFRIASMTKPVTAVAALILVEECRLRLDDPVDEFLPELADRRVLRTPASALDDTVPADRPITLRDLLTCRMGLGAIMQPPGTWPIQSALDGAGVSSGPDPFAFDADSFLKRLGGLPLLHQPGQGWLYDTSLDVLGVLVARASGGSLGDFMRERIFEPLDMDDTGFTVPAKVIGRLAGAYRSNAAGEQVLFDPAGPTSLWAAPQPMEAGASGLVSTVDDYHAFLRMLLDGGRARGARILSRPSVSLMTSNQITADQRASAPIFFREGGGWGFGLSVQVERDDLFTTPGRFGWDGGYGTSAYADPAEDMVGILLTQRMMDSPTAPAIYSDFWTTAYQAFED